MRRLKVMTSHFIRKKFFQQVNEVCGSLETSICIINIIKKLCLISNKNVLTTFVIKLNVGVFIKIPCEKFLGSFLWKPDFGREGPPSGIWRHGILNPSWSGLTHSTSKIRNNNVIILFATFPKICLRWWTIMQHSFRPQQMCILFKS